MAVDLYGRDIVSMWIPGSQLYDLRAMVQEAVKLFDARFTGSQQISIQGRFDCVASNSLYKAKGESQPVDLYGIKLNCREKGYFVSVVEPNPAKARNVQAYAKVWMKDDKGNGFWQEIMHFLYKPQQRELVELRYLPDCSIKRGDE